MTQTNQPIKAGLDNIIQGINTHTHQTKEQCINILDSFLKQYTNEDLGKFNKELEVIINKLSRARKEFDSTCFFVLIVGPLKSGKSSFVNILTRAQVSPTDVLECTAIPTIIGKAEGEHRKKITGYYQQQQNSATPQDVFNQIIDVLRGIEPQSTLETMITKETKEANIENLNDMIMVNENTNRPLLATIGVDKNGFIDDQIMIIDMPGLDGRIVNDKNPLYQSMVERADFIFFVQSSTSAINEATNDFLKWLLSNKLTQVPIRLIHNHHESLHFIKDEETQEMVERQIKAGEQCIKDMFNVTREFNHYKFNFAKIGYALMNPDKIKPEQIDSLNTYIEEYKKWEEEITQKLKEERQRIKDENCVTKCSGYISESLAIIAAIKQHISNRQAEIESKKLELNGLPNLIKAKEVSFADMHSIIENKLVTLNIHQSLDTHIDIKTNSICESISSKKTGAELKSLINDLAKAYSAINILDKCSDIWYYLRQETHQTILNAFNIVLEQVAKVLNDNIAWEKDIDEELLPTSISAFTPCYFDIEENYQLRDIFSIHVPWTKRYYQTNESKEYLKKYKKDCMELCQGKINGYLKEVQLAAKNIKHKWVKNIISQLEERTATIVTALAQETKTLTQYQKTLNEMEKTLTK